MPVNVSMPFSVIGPPVNVNPVLPASMSTEVTVPPPAGTPQLIFVPSVFRNLPAFPV